MPLPINIDELILGRVVENERIEYKKGWNPGAIYRSICAFANDIEDIGGGYIIVGVEERNGRPVLPPVGINDDDIDKILREMIGYNNLIRPVYFPKVSIEEVQGKKVLVIWAFSGDARPYEVPDEIKSKDKNYQYYIRSMSSTVKTNKQQREELIVLANKIPFDDRPNQSADLNDISFTLVKEHLRLIKSKLLGWIDKHSNVDILSQMELFSGPPENRFIRNIALMMFSENPELFFPYTRVEIVHFPNGENDPVFKEAPSISGPVPYMIRQTLIYLKTVVLEEKVTKQPDQAEAIRVWNYPYTALEEIVANALYHRDYQTREPVEIRIYPDFIVFLNYGGPAIRIGSEVNGNRLSFSRRYRNRRLGDFLKELNLTEGKATGIPIIKKALDDNGSPKVEFETDEGRSYFQVILRAHRAFRQNFPDDGVGEESGGVKSKNEGVRSKSEGVRSKSEGVKSKNEGVKSKSEGVKSKNEEVKSKNEEVKNENEGVKNENEGVKSKNEGVKSKNEGVKSSEGVKSKSEGVIALEKIITLNPGYRSPYYAKYLNVANKTIERWIRDLRERDNIEFRGSPRTGGYWPNEEM